MGVAPRCPYHKGVKTMIVEAGNANQGGRLSTVDLLITVACFVKKALNIINIKMS